MMKKKNQEGKKAEMAAISKMLTPPGAPMKKTTPIQFSCAICEQLFCSENILVRHMESVHKCVAVQLLKACPTCGVNFKEQQDFYPHVRSCAAAHPESANVLSKTSLVGGGTKGEVMSGIHVCVVCSHKLKSEIEALEHLMNWHQLVPILDSPPACYLCKAEFPSTDVLRDHLVDSHGGLFHTTFPWLQMRCEVCHKCFNAGKHMRNHALYSHQTPNLMCEPCGLTFKNPTYFLKHKNTVKCMGLTQKWNKKSDPVKISNKALKTDVVLETPDEADPMKDIINDVFKDSIARDQERVYRNNTKVEQKLLMTQRHTMMKKKTQKGITEL